MSTLNSKPKGHSHKLLVRVIEAYDLPRGDVLSKSDPFVSVKVKGFFHRKRKTPYIAVPIPVTCQILTFRTPVHQYGITR